MSSESPCLVANVLFWTDPFQSTSPNHASTQLQYISERLPDNPASSFVFDFTDFIWFHHVYMFGKKTPGTCCFPKLDFLLPFSIDLKVESAWNPDTFHGFLGIHSRFRGPIRGANNQKRQILISLDIIRNIIEYHPKYHWISSNFQNLTWNTVRRGDHWISRLFQCPASEILAGDVIWAHVISATSGDWDWGNRTKSSHCGIDIL